MRKIILHCSLCPGDILMLTAAVRDLHRTYPGQFMTDVRTSCAELWENNPYITALEDNDPAAAHIECHYPLVQLSNQGSWHFINGYTQFLNDTLGVKIRPTEFCGDIHLSPDEIVSPSQVQQVVGRDLPYWLIVAGGKYDYTIKWWQHSRFQAVVDHFRGKLLFVQAGHSAHYHPPLHGVIDARGDSSLRSIVNLMHHAQGAFCPVTFFMHLAAAVPGKGKMKSRPCVTVAGGREPPHWEAYPGHQFIHTVGALDCCATGGCWRARTVPLGDGDPKDQPEFLCRDVVQGLPRCMDMITPAEVINRINLYLSGRQARLLTREEAELAHPHLRRSFREMLKASGSGSAEIRGEILPNRNSAPGADKPTSASDSLSHRMGEGWGEGSALVQGETPPNPNRAWRR